MLEIDEESAAYLLAHLAKHDKITPALSQRREASDGAVARRPWYGMASGPLMMVVVLVRTSFQLGVVMSIPGSNSFENLSDRL